MGVDRYMDNISYHSHNKYKTKKNTVKARFLFVFLAIIIVILLFFYFKYNQRYVVRATYGEIVDGFMTDALIVRDEISVTSPITGRVFTHFKEGDRVSYGRKIIDIKNAGETLSLYNQQAGIISYATDELENILSPEKIDKINIENYSTFNRKYKQLVSGNSIDRGSPVFRIINNYELYLVIKIASAEAERYHKNELIFVKPEAIDIDIIKGHIICKKSNEQEAILIVALNRFIEEWLNMRRVKIKFIKNIYRGIVIPKEAVFSQPQGDGVLVYNNEGDYKFTKVKIKHENKEKVIVTGIDIGDNIIFNPAEYNYGRGGIKNGS